MPPLRLTGVTPAAFARREAGRDARDTGPGGTPAGPGDRLRVEPIITNRGPGHRVRAPVIVATITMNWSPMNLLEIGHYLADVAADHKLLLLAVVIAVGSLIGSVSVKGFSLGPAAVLFFALATSAYDERLRLPEEVGSLGLILFAYTIGVRSGPSFFSSWRTGRAVIGVVVVAIVVSGLFIGVLGRVFGLEPASLSGVFAGSLTNTPALAAATEAWRSDLPTVGYSITYLFGVLGMLFVSLAGLRTRRTSRALVTQPADEPRPKLQSMTIRVDVDHLPDLYQLAANYDDKVVFSRIMTGDTPHHPGTVGLATDTTRPRRGDILTVVGDEAALQQLCSDIGHPSTVALTLDRSTLDYRRMVVSNDQCVGVPLSELRLDRRFGARVTRIRRGDVDFLATDDFVLQPGDRVRVVAPRSALADVSAFLGDSEQKLGFSMIGLSLGLVLGILVGLFTIPLPGGVNLSLGLAGGVLIVGLVLGNLGKSGSIVWTIPYTSSMVLTQLGTVLFLAYAGSNSGAAFLAALSTPIWWKLLLLGMITTVLFGTMLLLGGKYVADFTGRKLAGAIAAAQTQPAVLAYAQQRTDNDPDVSLGYALVYPAAMITKVIFGPLVGRF